VTLACLPNAHAGIIAKDELSHLLSYSDLCYSYAAKGESVKTKSSDPIEILCKHAVHLFLGGNDDVTDDLTLENYTTLLFCRDSLGKKMIIKSVKMNGHIRNNLKDAMMDSTSLRSTKEKIVPDLWIEAKVTPKKDAIAQVKTEHTTALLTESINPTIQASHPDSSEADVNAVGDSERIPETQDEAKTGEWVTMADY